MYWAVLSKWETAVCAWVAMRGDYDAAIEIFDTTSERMEEAGMQMHQLAAARVAAFYRGDSQVVALCEAGLGELCIADPAVFNWHILPIVVERDP